ncbi:MAG: 50S ribosomal protein L18Ae [Candidatus Helarchaeota archaeon]
MSIKTFRVKGTFQRNKKRQEFVKEIPGIKKEDVLELVLSTLGSLYHVKRRDIKIDNVEELNQ